MFLFLSFCLSLSLIFCFEFFQRDHRGGSDFLFFYRVKKEKKKQRKSTRVDQRGGLGCREAEFPLLRFLEEWMEKLKEGEQKERHLHKEAVDNRGREGLEK